MSELRPIGTEFDELGGRFRVVGHRSQPDGDPVEEVECLRPVPFARHKSGRRRFKPPKLDITLPGLPPEVLAAFAEIQAAAPPKSPRQPKTTTRRKRPTYHRYVPGEGQGEHAAGPGVAEEERHGRLADRVCQADRRPRPHGLRQAPAAVRQARRRREAGRVGHAAACVHRRDYGAAGARRGRSPRGGRLLGTGHPGPSRSALGPGAVKTRQGHGQPLRMVSTRRKVVPPGQAQGRATAALPRDRRHDPRAQRLHGGRVRPGRADPRTIPEPKGFTLSKRPKKKRAPTVLPAGIERVDWTAEDWLRWYAKQNGNGTPAPG